ncbi:Cobalt-zinc-cadmium resistance protein CzcA/CusA [Dissulfuribacter thermophilus]|uniref:Cobalt-zinc-cadmium resistance protein CzcA/CusA n=1 Tax=Dissulfuribacter thermophilus TaxID=1156395 RepID=A0A1B9F7B7_9BACT|nr:efflux RND transporter permease subunit [Dissulfuribacter thermophilus]OCC15839.1 Cobalt-zinc-cadmium resistance protein CzcA/CusA [Dissulfuribacter thermophilus]
MIKAIIAASIRDRFLVLLGGAFLFFLGIWALKTIPLDAIPDLSDTQVIVFTEYPGQAPQVVEDQVTYPLSTAMLSVPKAEVVRGYSFFGLSFVYIIFEDGTDLYWARSRVLEALNFVKNRLPDGVNPTLGPDATGVGWVYEYALVDRSGKHDLSELRSLQDWFLKYQLQTVPGVSEVASIGGFVKQYQIVVDPNALAFYKIPITVVRDAIKAANQDTGGRLIELSETEYMVRAKGYIRGIEDIENIPLRITDSGTPLLLKDVANVRLGPELRRGLADLNGDGEVVGGIVVMRTGENALLTIEKVKEKLKELAPGLPEGVEIVTVYDRSSLIERAIASLKEKLIEECIVVSIVCVVFLFHIRSSLVAILTLPLGILFAFIIMKVQGINANIMSLGGIAIAIGAMVDGAIVMIENAHKRLEAHGMLKGTGVSAKRRWEVIGEAAKEVGPALFFSLLIITFSFMPIFSLEAQEGRLFKPLAFTKTYAMAGAALLAITLVPALMGFFIRGRIVEEAKNPLNRFLHFIHRPVLKGCMKVRWMILLAVLTLLGATMYPLRHIGSEFMPPLDEGDILYMPTTFPGISITKAKELLQQTDRILKEFPEVESVFGKVGRAETATDPAPLSMIETVVRLKPREKWPDPSMTTQDVMKKMDKELQIPGLSNTWTMPIKTRIDMLSTGIKTPIGIKISGPDLGVLEDLSKKIESLMKELPETISAYGDRAQGGYFLDIEILRDKAAQYGLSVKTIQSVITSAIGGMKITETVEGLERYPVNLRYPRDFRTSIDTIKRVLVPTPTGAQIPLGEVAKISLTRGAPVIKTENARPNAWVYVDISTSDIGGFVEKAKGLIQSRIKLPPNYAISWSGQFEYMERAMKKLKFVVPATLVLIFLLLYFNFRNISAPLIVMTSIPFALIGGIWLIYVLGYNFSVAVAVGFIALAGVATEIGVLVLTFIDHEVEKMRMTKSGGVLSRDEIKAAVLKGTSERVRPIVMTATAITLGLIPIMMGGGAGSQTMQRIAAPMVGGMVSTTLLSLLVLPLIYGLLLEGREALKRKGEM